LPFKKTQPRLRLLTSTLCLVIATLVLFWGSAFKASLYHTLRDLGHIPTAKLLTEHERPAHTDIIAVSKSDFPPAPHTTSHIPDFAISTLRRALTPQLPLLAQIAWKPSSQAAALGFCFHHPPPFL
jgi:hypothetical protein